MSNPNDMLNDGMMGENPTAGGPPSHYRLWAAFRGVLYLLMLAVAVTSIPRTTLLWWGATLAVTAVLASLGIRWLYAAASGRLSPRMLRAMDPDNDQTMGSL